MCEVRHLGRHSWLSSNTLDNSSLLRPWKTLIPMSFKMSFDFPSVESKIDVALIIMHLLLNWELRGAPIVNINNNKSEFKIESAFWSSSVLNQRATFQLSFLGGQKIKIFFVVRQLFVFSYVLRFLNLTIFLLAELENEFFLLCLKFLWLSLQSTIWLNCERWWC